MNIECVQCKQSFSCDPLLLIVQDYEIFGFNGKSVGIGCPYCFLRMFFSDLAPSLSDLSILYEVLNLQNIAKLITASTPQTDYSINDIIPLTLSESCDLLVNQVDVNYGIIPNDQTEKNITFDTPGQYKIYSGSTNKRFIPITLNIT